jgi:hypothetical protein
VIVCRRLAYDLPLIAEASILLQGAVMTGKREQVEPHEGDKRYVRRDEEGQFSESDDLNRSLSSDDKQQAKNKASPGQGDKGDPRGS